MPAPSTSGPGEGPARPGSGPAAPLRVEPARPDPGRAAAVRPQQPDAARSAQPPGGAAAAGQRGQLSMPQVLGALLAAAIAAAGCRRTQDSTITLPPGTTPVANRGSDPPVALG